MWETQAKIKYVADGQASPNCGGGQPITREMSGRYIVTV